MLCTSVGDSGIKRIHSVIVVPNRNNQNAHHFLVKKVNFEIFVNIHNHYRSGLKLKKSKTGLSLL